VHRGWGCRGLGSAAGPCLPFPQLQSSAQALNPRFPESTPIRNPLVDRATLSATAAPTRSTTAMRCHRLLLGNRSFRRWGALWVLEGGGVECGEMTQPVRSAYYCIHSRLAPTHPATPPQHPTPTHRQHMYAKLSKACEHSYWNAPEDGECALRLQETRVRCGWLLASLLFYFGRGKGNQESGCASRLPHPSPCTICTAPPLPCSTNQNFHTTKPLTPQQEELAALNMYNVLEECHHGPPAPGPSALEPASHTQLLRQQRAVHAERAARYAALLTHYRGWPVTGGVKKGLVRNWAHLMKGLGHNPPCTGGWCLWCPLRAVGVGSLDVCWVSCGLSDGSGLS